MCIAILHFSFKAIKCMNCIIHHESPHNTDTLLKWIVSMGPVSFKTIKRMNCIIHHKNLHNTDTL